MTGSVRLQRLVLVPRGAFVSGVFTGELREHDGSIIGVESRRAIAPADLVRDERGFRPWVRPFSFDLMGITVDVAGFAVDPALAFPRLDPPTRRPVAALRTQDFGPGVVRLLVLATPLLALGLILLLQRVEAWCAHAPGAVGRPHRPANDRTRPATSRSTDVQTNRTVVSRDR